MTAATRPLNLYYGLCQAGMAIAAAHAEDPWSFGSHGLQLTDREGDFIEMEVRPEGSGGFQKVADATGSPVITEPVSLGALWASLPDLSESGVLPDSAHPGPLIVLADDSPARQPRASVLIRGEMPSGPAFIARFGEVMTGYPSAAGYVMPMEEDDRGRAERVLRRGRAGVSVPRRPIPAPGVDTTRSTPPSSLMTWWLLLYSFSILARYQPRRWSQLLDLDTSEVSALLQYALEEALTSVPHLVLEALDGEPHLLPKPLSFKLKLRRRVAWKAGMSCRNAALEPRRCSQKNLAMPRRDTKLIINGRPDAAPDSSM